MRMIIKRNGVDTRRIVEEYEVGEIPAVEIRARAAGYTYWIRLADRDDEMREIVVIGQRPEEEDRVKEILGGWSAAIPVPVRELKLLADIRDLRAKPEWADTRPDTGPRQLELALLSHFDPEHTTTRLIHLYLFHLSVAHTSAEIHLDAHQSVQWLINNWDLGDEQILYTPEPLLGAGYAHKKRTGSLRKSKLSQSSFAGLRSVIARNLGGES